MGLPVSTFRLARLLRSRNGNVSMMYALVAPVLVFGAGAAIDYGRAAQIHTKLNAAADAAALAALTPAMLQQPATAAQAAAVSMFNGLTKGIPGLTAGATQVTVTITVGSTALVRNVEVNYATSVNTIFAQVLGVSALPVQGVSEASAQVPPNIDFYVLLDNSPSMALPATTAGITKMQSLTTSEEHRRLRLRLPSGQHKPTPTRLAILAPTGRRRPLSLPRRRRQAATSIATRPSMARRSITISSPATTTSRFALTS